VPTTNGRPLLLSQHRPIQRHARQPRRRRQIVGKLRRLHIGALSVADRQNADIGRPGAVRGARDPPILSESKVGFVFTNGDPTGLTRNTVAGVDFQYLDSNFMGRNVIQADGYYQRSFSNKNGDDDSQPSR
jgi:hypothetical protein